MKRRTTIFLYLCSILLLLLLLPSVAQAQKAPTALEKLTTAIKAKMDGRILRNSIAAVEITDARSGAILFSHNANLLLRPASNTKLFTSAGALLGLDESTGFVTRLYRHGDATLRCLAGGDPMFSEQDIQKLIEFAFASGMPRVDTLILDAGAFDSTSFGEGWMWDDENDPFIPALSPFCIEGNLFTLHVKRSSKHVDSIEVSTSPLIADLEWTYTPASGSMELRRVPRSNEVHLSGTLPASKSFSKRLPVWRPERTFAMLLAGSLQRSGLADTSLVILYGQESSAGSDIGSFSRSLNAVVAASNKQSNNLAAEMLLRLLGLHANKGQASAAGGIEAMLGLFSDRGLSTSGISLVDGSGISFYNLCSVNSLTRVLRMMAAHARFEEFRSSLAVASVDGTLRNRMKNEARASFFQGKTGTLRGVSTLSGYVQAPRGRLLTVVIFMQNFTGNHTPYRRIQDRIIQHCIDYSAASATAIQSR